MNAIEVEGERVDRLPALLREAGADGSPDRAARKTQSFLLRTLLFTAALLIALGTRMKLWYRSASTQGYLPNLHID